VLRPDTTKLAANYLAFIKLASIRVWLRANESAPYSDPGSLSGLRFSDHIARCDRRADPSHGLAGARPRVAIARALHFGNTRLENSVSEVSAIDRAYRDFNNSERHVLGYATRPNWRR
jgi:hypothetical protein